MPRLSWKTAAPTSGWLTAGHGTKSRYSMRIRPKTVLYWFAAVVFGVFVLSLIRAADKEIEQKYGAETKTTTQNDPPLNISGTAAVLNINNAPKQSDLEVANETVYLPNIYQYLPHLTGIPDALKPLVKYSAGRTGVSVVIGVPTVKRQADNYVVQTLQSLIAGLGEDEVQDCLIVVFVCSEDAGSSYANELSAQLQTEFKSELSAGLLEVIAPSPQFYPNFKNLKLTFGDSFPRVKWRTKQNLDYSLLMLYAKSRGKYYMQLEDDVITNAGYLTTIKKFVQSQPSSNWLMIEFSTLGFIGKLFRSSDLPFVAEFFLMFHGDKPVDWLLSDMFFVKVCSPETGKEQCDKAVSEIRVRYTTSLFQHIGTKSSLAGKEQTLKDKTFVPGVLRAHKNPKAVLSTSLEVYQSFNLDSAYTGTTFFWAKTPRQGDKVQFKFDPPIFIEKYLFRSGTSEHPGDLLYNTTLEVLPVPQVAGQPAGHQKGSTNDGFIVLNHFEGASGVVMGTMNASMGAVDTLRLMVQSDSRSWVIISEIHIKERKPDSQKDKAKKT